MSAPESSTPQATARFAPADATLDDCAAAAARLGSADRLVAGLLDLDCARPLAFDALVSVADVAWSAAVKTACVECTDRPRVLLNPAFVERWCDTPQRLAMLLLHELSHISLGHTRLYSRATPAQAVAFDAVVNAHVLASLARHGIDPTPYAALPRAFYDADERPAFLLRPPDGWPEAPVSPAGDDGDPLRDIHRRLYPRIRVAEATPRGACDVTYGEIVAALRSAEPGDPPGDGGTDNALADLLEHLLGGHGATDTEAALESSGRDAAAAEELAKVVAALDAGDALPGAGPGGAASIRTIERHRAERQLERALERLLRRVFVDQGEVRSTREEAPLPILSVDPTRDRRAAVRRAAAAALGAPAPLLFHSKLSRQRPERHGAVIYLDVSGSMNGLVDRLHAALVSLHRLLTARVYVFSTEVFELSRASFLEGRLGTTWGTDVAPVVRHLAELARTAPPRRRIDRALLLTDGYFNAPDSRLARRLREAGAALHLGVIGGGTLHEGELWVASATRLPDPSSSNFEA